MSSKLLLIVLSLLLSSFLFVVMLLFMFCERAGEGGGCGVLVVLVGGTVRASFRRSGVLTKIRELENRSWNSASRMFVAKFQFFPEDSMLE